MPTPRATDTAYLFRPGQWAVRFDVADGFYGGGALLFTSTKAAWMVNAEIVYSSTDTDEVTGYAIKDEDYTLSIGRRWYGTPRGRVRSISGVGVFGNYRHIGYGDGYVPYKDYAAGMYGEFGATVFLAPELSLGATWHAELAAGRDYNDSPTISVNGGQIRLEGAFYF